jgi:DNA-binding response OmpR family regulator
MRILLVEDDNMIGQSLKQALSENGLAVDWVQDGVLAQLIHGLRRKLGQDVIRNVRGLGWRVSKEST